MILINRDAPPETSIFYIACVIMDVMDSKNKKIDNLHIQIEEKLGFSVNYNTLLLSLNFLFLVNRIVFSEGEVKCT